MARYRRYSSGRRRSRSHNNISIGEGLGHVAATGFVTAAKACIKVDRAIRTAGRVATLPFRIGRGIYRTFKL